MGDQGREAGIAMDRVEVGLLFNIQVDPRLQTVVNFWAGGYVYLQSYLLHGLLST